MAIARITGSECRDMVYGMYVYGYDFYWSV